MYKEAINHYLQKTGHTGIHLKAVLFDMDGVLFNSMPNHASSWHKVMERMGFGQCPNPENAGDEVWRVADEKRRKKYAAGIFMRGKCGYDLR